MEKIKAKIESVYCNKSDNVELDEDDLKNYGLTDITLRPYQLAGVNWMRSRMKHGHGCLLGDEMGLGKTCQTISVLVALAGTGESHGPHLLLSPLSVLNNWKSELKRFAPGLKFMAYVGDKDTRADLRTDFKDDLKNYNVLLTTYEVFLKDEYFLRKFKWYTLIVDEAHRLKNRESLLHQSLLECDIEHRLLLTGTPVQNNLRELYTLLSFVAPSIFKFRYCEEFLERYSDVEDKSEASELHDLLKPFLLRRVKSQVLKDLPQRSEVVLFHGLSALQKKYYKAILTKDLDVFETGYNAPKTRLMNVLMQLRKCVNHPYLFDGVEPEPFQLGEHLVEASGKLELLDELLAYLRPRQHKVLIFSQMTRALDIVQDYLGYRGYSYERLDGSVRGEERYLAIKNFNDESSTFIFLLSTKAGGVGLNLTSADTVIFLDSDFNPQNDLQAAARAHRIGQTRPVKVVRLIGRSSIEEITLRRAEAKLKLTETVIEGEQFAHGVESAKNKEDLIADNALQLQDILKFGVDKLLENEDSSIEKVDFDTILGPTVDGEWSEVEDRQTMETLAAETMQVDIDDDEEEDGGGGDMYRYEGTDYSQQPSSADRDAIKKLVDAIHQDGSEDEEGDGRPLRRTKTNVLHGLLPETMRKPRKPLTPEQLAERNRKRAETIARKAKQEEEEEKRREERRIKRRNSRWAANNYASLSLRPSESDDEEDEDMVNEANDDGDGTEHDINYVTGDVTKPDSGISGDVIIVHCVDDSGSWGSGGLFSAISRRSKLVEQQYELAGEMRDLSLGDVHLIALEDRPDRNNNGTEYVALLVAQTRDKHGQLTGIKLSHLSDGMKKLYTKAKALKASVHLPRIGHSTPAFNWYGTERLIRKHLAARGIPTYIYYFKRSQQAPKRRKSSSPEPSDDTSPVPSTSEDTSDEPQRKVRKVENPFSDSPSASSSVPTKSRSKIELPDGLPDFMQGVAAYFVGVPAETKRTLTRYLIAYDGDVHSDIEDYTTHVVVSENPTTQDKDEIRKISEAYQDVTVTRTTWLTRCFVKQRKVDSSRHLYNMK